MPSLKSSAKASIAVMVAVAFGLGACGIKGELETPPPMWGKKDAPKPAKPAPQD